MRNRLLFADALAHWIGPRGRTIVHTGAWSLIAKAAAATNLFLTVPFVLHAVGAAEFGMWATLVSLVTFAGFLDFGFGNGTMNLVAAAHGRGDAAEIGRIVNEGRRTLALVALCLGITTLVALPLVPWHRMLGMPVSLARISRIAAALVLFTIALAVPLNLANRVQLGIGRGDRTFRWQAIGQLLTAALVICLAKNGASLIVLVAAAVATPLVGSAANSWLLWRDPRIVTVSTTTRDRRIASHIRREGSLFFVLQLCAALAFSADLPLILVFSGPSEAGNYAIVQRLFSIISLGLSLVWAPLWPVYRHALAAGDHNWVKRTLSRSMLMAVLFAISLGAILAFGFERIASLWVHRLVPISGLLLAGFAVWCVMDAAGTAIATFFNAASVMRYQLITSCAFAMLCFGGKVWVLNQLGIEWMPWVTVAAYCAANALPLLWFRKRIFSAVFARKY